MGGGSAANNVEVATTGRSDAPKVLFVSHEATRSGAPIMFLHYLRWLADHTDLRFEILLLAGGPLADDFARVAPTTCVEALGTSSASYLEAGMARAGFPRAGDRLKLQRVRRNLRDLVGFDALYLNSTTSAFALRVLPEVPPLLFSHVHELDSAFRYWFPEPDRSLLLSQTDWYVACADAVARNLVDNHAVPPDRISRHYEFIQPPRAPADGPGPLRATLGLGPDAHLVGGSGQVIWRKGPDLFVQMAAALVRNHPDLDVHFAWVGSTDHELTPVHRDIEHLGLGDRIHFVGEVDDPAGHYADLDVFCLTSREDPYPLVMLEAAALGTPIVGFANGGVVEFADEHADATGRRAEVIAYLDAESMADVVAGLLRDPGTARALGRRGQDHVLTHHVTEVAAPALYEDLARRLGRAPGARPASTQPVATGPNPR